MGKDQHERLAPITKDFSVSKRHLLQEWDSALMSKTYGVYTGLVGSSLKPFSPLNPPILGDFEDSVSPKLGG